MASFNLGQDVANTKKKKIGSCSDCDQILFSIHSCIKSAINGSLININPSGLGQLNFYSAEKTHMRNRQKALLISP